MSFSNFDTGSSGSEGPWIAWSARGTLDGQIDQKQFLLRDQDGKKPFDGFKTAGVILDIHTMKTGWQKSEGVAGQAPDWKWNASVSHMQPQPGEDYKKGFSIKCAIGGGKTATWEQAGAATWGSFVALVPYLQQAPGPDMLPLVKITGVKVQQFKRGSTVEPVLAIEKWVPRPACLKEGAAGEVATEPPPPAPAAPAQVTPAAPVAALADDVF